MGTETKEEEKKNVGGNEGQNSRKTKTIETQAMLNGNDAGMRVGRGGTLGERGQKESVKHVYVREGIKTIFKTTFIHL